MTVASKSFASLVRSLEMKLARQRESVKDTEEQLKAIGRLIDDVEKPKK